MRPSPRSIFHLTALTILAAHAPAHAQAPVTFTDVSVESGIAGVSSFVGTGSVWFDYDGDGDLDAYLNSMETADWLMRQNADGTFTNVLFDAGAQSTIPEGGGLGVSAIDTDNDGDLDLYIVNNTLNNGPGNFEPNFFFRNNGDGTFTDTGNESGLANLEFSFANAAWLDVNRDGLIDVYLPTTADTSTTPNLTVSYLMIQRPDGTFINRITGEMRDDTRNKGLPLAWDYDNDGDLDLSFGFTSGSGGNGGIALFRYSGIATDYVEVSAEAGLIDPALTISHAPGDYDNDGDLDLYVCRSRVFRNFLYRNNGDGTFTDVAEAAGVTGNFPMVGTRESCFGVQWADFDNDGDLDLYLPTTTNGFSAPFPNCLYFNNGDGTFTEMGAEAGANVPDNQVGSSIGDYNRDGFVDILSVGVGGGSNRLLRNDGNANHWLALDLVGTVSNRSAIGARITLVSGSLSQIRELASSAGYLSQNSLTSHFGLGLRLSVDEITVRWPNGLLESFPPPASIDQYITLTEGTGTRLFPLNGAQHFEMYD